MIRLNIHEAKTHLSGYLNRLPEGESIVLCKRNEPVAEIRRLPRTRRTKRPLGLAAGKLKVPPEFFKPLPPALLKSFGGQ